MRLLILVASVLVIGCEANKMPTAVSPTRAQIAGAWRGTFNSATYAPAAITLNLTQTDERVTGAWTESEGTDRAIGAVNGTVDATTFTGTITFTFTGGPTCSGSFSGPASTTTLDWSSAGFTTGDCGLTAPGNPQVVRLALEKQR